MHDATRQSPRTGSGTATADHRLPAGGLEFSACGEGLSRKSRDLNDLDSQLTFRATATGNRARTIQALEKYIWKINIVFNEGVSLQA
jgi:hypothetical protein